MAQIGPAKGVGLRPEKARPARGRRTSAMAALLCMMAGLPARGPRRARRASRLRTGSTVGGLKSSFRCARRFGESYAQLRRGCALTGLFRELNVICGADVTQNRLMTLEPMKAPLAANTDPRSENLVAPWVEDRSRSAAPVTYVLLHRRLREGFDPSCSYYHRKEEMRRLSLVPLLWQDA